MEKDEESEEEEPERARGRDEGSRPRYEGRGSVGPEAFEESER